MSTTNTELPPPTGNISQCLSQMMSDAHEIEKRLLDAPADLTAKNELNLYEIVREIKKKLEQAKEAWPD